MSTNLVALYRRASDEGRLHPDIAIEYGLPTGTVRCLACGMLAHTKDDADRCCAGAERNLARPLRESPVRYAAVMDKRAFNIAVVDMMRAAGKKNMRVLSRLHGFGDRFLERFCTGEAKYMQARSWESLCVMFGGDPPGCARVRSGMAEGEVNGN